MLHLLVLLVSMSSVRGYLVAKEWGEKIKIDEPEPGHVMVREGGNITLTCSASHPWFLCLWVHPGDDGEKLCSIHDDGEHMNVCSGIDGAEIIVAEDNKCHVKLTNVTLEEAGDWMCLLSQAGVYHTDRVMTKLSVATPTNVHIKVTYQNNLELIENDPYTGQSSDIVEFYDVVQEDFNEDDILELLEEDSVTVKCEAEGGYPHPQFYWRIVEEGQEMESGNQILKEEMIQNQHNVTNLHTSSLKYTAKVVDHGKTLMCATRQRDINTGEALYNVTSSVKLSITPKASPLQAYFTEQQDIVAGIIISTFLILFCVIIIIIFTIRGSKTVATGKKLNQDTKAHESYIIFLEEPSSNSDDSGDSHEGHEVSHGVKERSSDKESGIDVSQGDFVSFSSSDLYSCRTGSDGDHQGIIRDDHHQSSDDQESHHEVSSEGCAESEGGLSNTSVFDCHHGCFHDQHDHQNYSLQLPNNHKEQIYPEFRRYYTDAVLNTDL